MRGTSFIALVLLLGACTTIHGPGELDGDEPEAAMPVCGENDTRPGCRAESPACANPHDYLCEFAD
ncbi:MAG: hypothetical protein JSU66_11885 [Deltaproteobacteria bacterium]|nr:MAG: hypothetical protein JSU66_11885 [Deltaproteobacteria bacterium]